MERLISLFRQPEQLDFDEPTIGLEPQLLETKSDNEPEYFVQLMQYLRARNDRPARDGSD